MTDSLIIKIVEDTARRLGLSVDPAIFENGIPGVRPRLGEIIDASQKKQHQYKSGTQTFTIGTHLFDPAELSFHRDGTVVRLTEKERDILLALLQAPGQRIERRTMLDKIWGYAGGVETHTLETHIYRLRQKIEADPAAPVLLITDGDGYCLVSA